MTLKSVQVVSCFYSLLLKMYPRSFRNDFASEMSEVFTLAVSRAGARGLIPLIGLFLMELAEFPINLLREHLANPGIKSMIDRLISSHGRLWPVQLSALGFGFGFAILGVINGFLSAAIRNGGNPGLVYGWIVPVLARAFAGGLGGMVVGLSIDHKKVKYFAIAGALSYPLGNLLVNRIIAPLYATDTVFQSAAFRDLLIAFLTPTLIGALIGASFGVVLKDRLQSPLILWGRQWIRFTLAGAAGFLFGHFANILSTALMQSFLRYLGWPNRPQDGGLWFFIFAVAPNLLYGVVIGILLGLAAGRIRKRQAT